MRDFTRFFAKVALLGLILVVGLMFVFFVLLPPDYSDTFAIMGRKMAYLQNAEGPKIVLMGGSNVLVGVDSPLLEQRTGRKVANIAIQASIPLEMQINQAEPYLKPGDLVVISAEYNYYVMPDGNPAIVARQLEAYTPGWFDLAPADIARIPDILKDMFQAKMARLMERGFYPATDLGRTFSPYDSLPAALLDQFDAQGDYIAALDKPPRSIVTKMFLGDNQIDPRIFDIFNDIDRRVRARGAVAVLTFPSGRQSNCNLSGPAFLAITAQLQEKVTMPFVGTPASYCFPDNLFVDTEYHLDRQGRQLRTEQMLRDLAPYLK